MANLAAKNFRISLSEVLKFQGHIADNGIDKISKLPVTIVGAAKLNPKVNKGKVDENRIPVYHEASGLNFAIIILGATIDGFTFGDKYLPFEVFDGDANGTVWVNADSLRKVDK